MSLPGNDLLVGAQNAQDLPTLANKLTQYLRRYLVPSVQNTASNAAVDPNGNMPAPAQPESISVTTAGELAQVVVTHNAPIQKGIQYITTIATNPSFTGGAIIHDHGSSRSPAPINLPTMAPPVAPSTDPTPHQYFFATVAQYPGSPPSKPTFFGGVSPTPVTMSGSTVMALQPGTGSGTTTNGNQALQGLGNNQIRLAPAAKRTVNS
jgi:hypothetical protein